MSTGGVKRARPREVVAPAAEGGGEGSWRKAGMEAGGDALQQLHQVQRPQSPLRKVRKAKMPDLEHNSVLLGRDKFAAGPKAPVKLYREVRLRTVGRSLRTSKENDSRALLRGAPGVLAPMRTAVGAASSAVSASSSANKSLNSASSSSNSSRSGNPVTPKYVPVISKAEQQKRVAHAIAEVAAAAAIAAGPGSKQGAAKSFREARLRAERRKLGASLRLADLHLRDLPIARHCAVCHASLAREQERRAAISCMRAKRDFLATKLRKLDRTIQAQTADAPSAGPAFSVKYAPMNKRPQSEPVNTVKPPPASSPCKASYDTIIPSPSIAVASSFGGAGEEEVNPNGPNVRLGYVNYFRSLRSEGMTNKSCPVCTTRLTDMAAFLSTLDRLSFLANQRFFDK